MEPLKTISKDDTRSLQIGVETSRAAEMEYLYNIMERIITPICIQDGASQIRNERGWDKV